MHAERVRWFVACMHIVLLLLNRVLRSGLIWLISIGITIMAVIVYFIPSIRKR